LGHANDLWDRQISPDRAQPLADAVGLIRLKAMQAQLVLFGVNSNGLFAQLIRCAHYPDRNLTPVRDQDFAEFGHLASPRATLRQPVLTSCHSPREHRSSLQNDTGYYPMIMQGSAYSTGDSARV